MSQINYNQYLKDQRDELTKEKQAKIVEHYCNRNRRVFLPLIQSQLKYESENYKGYKSNSLILRMDFDDGRFIQYADNKQSNASFKHPNRYIIAIPGIPGSVKDFTPIEKRLEPNFCRFIHLFIPGFDNIDERRGPYKGTLEDGAKIIYDFLDKQGIKKVVIMMHSLGGFMSKYFAYRYPERVDGLIQIASIPISEWNGWYFMRDMFQNYYQLQDTKQMEYFNTDEARKIAQEGSVRFKKRLATASASDRRKVGPALHFAISDIMSMRKITKGVPGGIGEILHIFRSIDSTIPRLIAYSPLDDFANKLLYEEEIYNLLFVNNKVNYVLTEQPIKDIQLDLTNFQTNFVFRFDKATHFFHFQKADQLSVLVRHFIQSLDFIQISPQSTHRL